MVLKSEEAVEKKLLKDLKTGVYAFLILDIIGREKRMHGYGLISGITDRTDGLLSPSESTVYESLKQLEKLGLIRSYWAESPGRGPPRKYYELTEKGERILSSVRKTVYRLARILELASKEE